MNPFARITVTCCICGKIEENIYKVLVKEGWKINGINTKCKECSKAMNKGGK